MKPLIYLFTLCLCTLFAFPAVAQAEFSWGVGAQTITRDTASSYSHWLQENVLKDKARSDAYEKALADLQRLTTGNANYEFYRSQWQAVGGGDTPARLAAANRSHEELKNGLSDIKALYDSLKSSSE